MSQAADQRPFYLRKRNWILLIVAAPLMTGGLLLISGNQELERQLTELRKAGLPTRGEELNEFYAVPAGMQDTTSLWMTAIDAVTGNDLNKAASGLPFVGMADEPVVGEEWPELDAARSFLTSNAETMQAIRTAAGAGGAVRFPVDFRNGINTLLLQTQNTRAIARLLTLDAHVSQRDGNSQQAFQNIVDIYTLADSLQREPTFVSQLVRFAISSIASDTAQKLLPAVSWDDAQLAALQAVAANSNARDALALALAGEQALGLTAIDQTPPIPGFSGSNKRRLLRLYGDMLQDSELPWHEAIIRQKTASASLNANRGLLDRLRYSQVDLLAPASEQIYQSGARHAARQLFTIAALAAQRHRLAHGDFPNSLAEIAPEYLPAAFSDSDWADPFSGKPLGYLKTDEGLTVYSVGMDAVDDGGDIFPQEEGQPTDIGFFIKR